MAGKAAERAACDGVACGMAPTSRVERPRKIRMLVYPGAHLLDIAGPISLFATASQRGVG